MFQEQVEACLSREVLKMKRWKWSPFMPLKHRWLAGALALGVLLFAGGRVSAQISVITITVDENGNGTINGFGGLNSLPFAIQPDPGPGGLAAVLTYNLGSPPGFVAGDLLLTEPGQSGLSDVIRFNPDLTLAVPNTGTLVFYSDNTDGSPDLADTPTPPLAFYTNNIVRAEVGPEGNNGFTYTPTAGQPGFVAGASVPVTYVIQSDVPAAPVPEPCTLALLAIGGASLAGYRWRRNKAKA
jgi:hypothetical protein